MNAALLTSEIPADVSGWWVSEKYDGVRAIWTGTKLLSRNGKDLKTPASFTKGLPNRRLDGELWMGHGTFDELVSNIQKKGGDWAGVRFMVFDLAEQGTFEERDRKLTEISKRFPDHVCKAWHWRISSHDHLTHFEKRIASAGGEGCVIRRPGSQYRPGRMGDTIKIKRITPDVDRWQG